MASPPSTMRALQFSPASMAGGLEKSIQLNTSAQTPTPGPNQLLIRVHAAALNPVDYKLAEIPLVNRLLFGSIGTPGFDFAGEVADAGHFSSNTSDLQPGTRVFGRLSKPSAAGTLAQYTVCNKTDCVPMPDGVSFEQAAALGTVGQTAYQSIVANVHADSGEAVFINGGSGGCGSTGIQIAKALGCHVTTTCPTGKVEYCKALGADEVIDYTAQDVVTALRKLSAHHKYSLIVDNVGASGTLFPVCHEFTRPDAKYVQVGGSMSAMSFYDVLKSLLLPSVLGGGRRKYQFFGTQNKPDDLTQLGQWVKEGKVKMQITETFGMEDGSKAYVILKGGKTQGKIVIQIS